MKKLNKPLTLAIGAAMASGVLATNVQAENSPFAMNTLDSGYQLAMSDKPKKDEKGKGKKEGKCGEGKCGEGKCGGKKDSKKKEGKCGEKK